MRTTGEGHYKLKLCFVRKFSKECMLFDTCKLKQCFSYCCLKQTFYFEIFLNKWTKSDKLAHTQYKKIQTEPCEKLART